LNKKEEDRKDYC